MIVEGNPSEGALIEAAMKTGLEENQEKKGRNSQRPRFRARLSTW